MKQKSVMVREWHICQMEIFMMGNTVVEPDMERYEVVAKWKWWG